MKLIANGDCVRRRVLERRPKPAAQKRWWQKLLLAVLPVTVLCIGLEVLAHVLAPATEAENRRDADLFSRTFYVPDPDLIVRLRPNLRTNFRLIRPDAEAEVAINSEGFRGPEFAPPDPDALRVLVLGDSVTFGLHLDREQSWPRRMQQQLAKQARGRTVQVRNLSVPGYSTFQGRRLFQRHAIEGDFAPHLVVFAFGFNDSYLSDRDDVALQKLYQQQYGTWIGAVGQAMRKSRFLRLLLEPEVGQWTTTRVPESSLRDNLMAVAGSAAEFGIELLLVNTCLPSKYPRAVMREVADERDLTLVDCREMFAEHKRVRAAEPWAGDDRVRIEVPLPGVPIPPSLDDTPDAYMLLVADASRRLDYRRIALRDDGQGGDLVANDSVWSCLVRLPSGSRPEFAFGASGLSPSWPQMGSAEGILNGFHFLDLLPPAEPIGSETRTVRIKRVLSAPWPDLLLVPDPIHPNATGAGLIADAVTQQVLQSTAWRRLLK